METLFLRIDLGSLKMNPTAGCSLYIEKHGPVIVTHDTDADGNPVKVTTQQVAEHRSIYPEPEHLFEYEKLEVECSYCHKKFDFGELESDSYDSGDPVLDTWSDEVCPKCHIFDCLDVIVKEETLEEALKRKVTL